MAKGEADSYCDRLLRMLLGKAEGSVRELRGRASERPAGYGELVSQDAGGAGTTHFHHFDGLGSTDQVRDANQALVQGYRYRAFGEQLLADTAFVNRFTWVGRLGYYQQPDLAKYWLRARIHEPTLGRFLSRDPAMAEVNLYRFPGNNPIMIIDPSGMQGRCGQPGHLCRHQQRRGGEGLLVAAQTGGGQKMGQGKGMGMGQGQGTGMGMGAGMRADKENPPFAGDGGGKGRHGGGWMGGGGGGGPRRMRMHCPGSEGTCCEVHPPGSGWWSNPVGIRHENWQEAECTCGQKPPNCTVDFHKVVYIPGRAKPVHKIMHRPGRCVRCDAPYRGGGGGGEKKVCGPNITALLNLSLARVATVYFGWSVPYREVQCRLGWYWFDFGELYKDAVSTSHCPRGTCCDRTVQSARDATQIGP